MNGIFIETPRLILRQWKESDHEPYIRLNADKEVMEFFPSVKSAADTLAQVQRFSSHIAEHGYGFFAVERKDNQEFIGFTGIAHPGFKSYFTPCTEVGWRLSKNNWYQGFATEAAKACLQYGFNELSAEEIYAFTAIPNIRSEHVMEKIGMTKVGVFDHPMMCSLSPR